ncbi:MAG: phospholipase D-like domain-containing protein [bacterium]|nr:phospholipase D-like domain-containing protein [bacterium]
MCRKILLCIILVIAGAVLGIAGCIAVMKNHAHDRSTPIVGSLLSCFVPQEDCAQFIVDAIELGESEILVQAYGYTSKPILAALMKAKVEKKINVRVILDKSNEEMRYPGGTCTARRDIPVLVDHTVKIAHNKVLVIDRKHVITGSFNFTESAQKRNAENVILVKDDPANAARYLDNWNKRAAKSRAFKLQDVECT